MSSTSVVKPASEPASNVNATVRSLLGSRLTTVALRPGSVVVVVVVVVVVGVVVGRVVVVDGADVVAGIVVTDDDGFETGLPATFPVEVEVPHPVTSVNTMPIIAAGQRVVTVPAAKCPARCAPYRTTTTGHGA
jgi:hypothetical protein